jgi:hypothetical protein
VVRATFTQETIDKVERLRKNSGVATNADAVRLAIEISVVVLEAMEKGQKLLIESRDGSLERVFVPQVDGSYPDRLAPWQDKLTRAWRYIFG